MHSTVFEFVQFPSTAPLVASPYGYGKRLGSSSETLHLSASRSDKSAFLILQPPGERSYHLICLWCRSRGCVTSELDRYLPERPVELNPAIRTGKGGIHIQIKSDKAGFNPNPKGSDSEM